MPFSRDGLALIGSLAALGKPSVWVACGFGPHGIMEGPGSARILAKQIVTVCRGDGGGGGGDGGDMDLTDNEVLALKTMDACRKGAGCSLVK
jgi:hypothetical protein